MIQIVGGYRKILFFCSDGMPYILIALGLALVMSAVAFYNPRGVWIVVAGLVWILAFEVIGFFRDPERSVPQEPGIVTAPADGRVIDVSHLEEEKVFLKQPCTRVSIFMNVFNVHVNRAPMTGTIRYLRYNPGKFISAFKEKASLDNEQVLLGITGEQHGKEVPILVKLIAGLIARRIVLWRDLGQQLKQGERMSMIKFGSRVDVFLPASAGMRVRVGDRVKAGETVLAVLSAR